MSSSKIEVTIKPIIIAIILNVVFIIVYALNYAGIEIPLLRQTIGLFYSLLVPGMLLMLTLRINENYVTSFILYCVGLSFTLLLMLGLILNFGGPFIGITRPLSFDPVNTFTIAFSTTLCIFCFYRRRNKTIAFQVEKNLIPWGIAFLLPIFLAALGAHMVYYEGNNVLLLVLLAVIALMAFSPLLKKLQSLYPLIIFSASLSLVYHIVLSSSSFGGDNHHEYGFTNLVLGEGIWDPSSMATTGNSVASTNILIPMLCQLCVMNVLQAFKIAYPLVFSLIPVGLYLILGKQIKPEYAFFSAYFFLSVRPFYTYLSEFVKQGVAMFFLLLLIFVFHNRRDFATSLMLILFAFSLVTSHYGVSYIFLIFIPIALAVQLLVKNYEINPLISFFPFYVVLTIAWYMYVSAGYTFESVIALGERIASNIHEMFNPETSDTLALLLKENPSLSKTILKGLHLITNALIALGFLTFIFEKLKRARVQNWNLKLEYASFAIPSIGFLGASLFPYITRYGMTIDRVYSVVLLFLAPFCIIGSLNLLRSVRKALKRNINAVKVLAIFFAVFSLFNTGFITEIMGEREVGSVAISQARIKSYGTPFEKASLYCSYFAEEDISSAKWLSEYRTTSLISSDYYAIKLLSSYGMFVGMGSPMGKNLLTPTTIKDLDRGTYVYLRKINWNDGIMTKFIWEKDWIWNTSDIIADLNNVSMIYTNGGSVIFYNSP